MTESETTGASTDLFTIVTQDKLLFLLEEILTSLDALESKLDSQDDVLETLQDTMQGLSEQLEDLEFRTEYPGSAQDRE